MTLLRCLSSFRIFAADPATTRYGIACVDPNTGLGFTPVAMMLFYCGRQSQGADERTSMWGYGMAVSTTSRACTVSRAETAVGAAVAHGGGALDAVVAEINTTSFTGKLDIDEVQSGQVFFIVDDQFAADLSVLVMFYGSSTAALTATVTATECPAGAGNMDVNLGLALNTGLNDKALIICGSSSSGGAIGAVRIWTDRHDIGVVAGEEMRQWAIGASSVNASDPTNTGRHMRLGECIAWNNGDVMNTHASTTQWRSDGVRFAFTESADNTWLLILALKGERWQAGSFFTRTDTTAQRQSTYVRPRAMLFGSINKTESAADTVDDTEKISVGLAAESSSMGCMAICNAHNADPTDIGVSLQTDRIYERLDETNADKSTSIGAATLSSFDNSGFNWAMTDADPDAALVGFLAGGDEAGVVFGSDSGMPAMLSVNPGVAMTRY